MTDRTWLFAMLAILALAMALLAIIYLSKRQLPLMGYVFWGLVALVPLIGPFLVILSRPGESR